MNLGTIVFGQRETSKALTNLLGSHRKEFIGVTIVAAFLTGLEGVIHPLLTMAILDQAVSRGSWQRFLQLIAGYLFLGVFLNIAGYFISVWQMSVDNRVILDVSHRLLTAYYSKSYNEVLVNGDGYYVARIRGDMNEGVVPMLAIVRALVSQSVRLIALMSVVVFISWKAFFILCAIIPICAIASKRAGKRIRELASLERDQEATVTSRLTKSLAAFKFIKSFNLQPLTLKAFDDGLGDVLNSTFSKYKVIRKLQSGIDLTMVVSDFCTLSVGALFVLRRQMSFGAYIAFMNSFWRAATTLMEILSRVADLHAYGAITIRVMDFINERPASFPALPSSSVELLDVTCSLGKRVVLDKHSFAVSPRESVLIVGRNGSGKTTLANVVAGLLTPDEGTVFLPQTTRFITLPIAFPPLKTSQLGVSADLLRVFDLDLPTLLDSHADCLSAGQQQKLAVALALSGEADLYIFDEPLANLDDEARPLVMEEILRRTHSKSLLVIMHGGEHYHSLFDRVVQMEAPSIHIEQSLLRADMVYSAPAHAS